MKISSRKELLKVKPYVPGKPIEEVQRELGLKKVIKLASNENCFGPSPKAVRAINRSVLNINRYPDASSFYLKTKLAGMLGVKADNLVLGNGSDEVIVLAVKAFIEPGDEVIIADPTFLIYEIASQVQGAVIKFVPLTDGHRYDLEGMKRAVTAKTKLIFIANPDNPSGSYVTKAELDEFFKGIREDVLVFLDEAYFEFAAYGCKNYPNGLDYLDRPNVVIGRSFSKIYGLAGLRIGYGVSDPGIISCMEKVREPFNVNLLAQEAAAAALDDKAFLNKTLSHVEGQKKFLYSEFRKLGLEYVESATNFILVDVKKDCKAVFNSLLREGVIVRDMKAWGMDTFIRVTIGLKEENKRFVNALKQVLR